MILEVKLNYWIHGCSTFRNSLSNSSALSGSSISILSLSLFVTLYFAFIAFTVAHFFFFLILFEKIRWILQFEFVQEAGVTSMQPLVLQVRYFFFFFFFFSVLLAVLLCVFIFYFFWLHESDSKFGYFVFGSSCLADCITAGSECAVCKTTYAQTGSLLLSFACVAICPSAGVCLSILPYFIFWLKNHFHS